MFVFVFVTIKFCLAFFVFVFVMLTINFLFQGFVFPLALGSRQSVGRVAVVAVRAARAAALFLAKLKNQNLAADAAKIWFLNFAASGLNRSGRSPSRRRVAVVASGLNRRFSIVVRRRCCFSQKSNSVVAVVQAGKPVRDDKLLFDWFNYHIVWC